MQAWVIAKISIVWVVFISRIRCAIKAGIRSVAEQKLKQSLLQGSIPPVIAESSLFLDNCLLFVFIRTNSSFSLTLLSEISTDKSLGELEAEGSSAKLGWQDSLVFTT